MANLQLYTAAYVYVDGALLAEEASVTVNRATNSQPVSTVAKGYAGESPGAPTVEISVDNAVPAAGFEFNPGGKMEGLREVEFTVFAAEQTMTFKGFITSDTFNHAINAESKLSFTARGSFSDWS
jgi:hypothetical protein